MSRDYERISRDIKFLLEDGVFADEGADAKALPSNGNTLLFIVQWPMLDSERPALRSRPIRIGLQGYIVDALDDLKGDVKQEYELRILTALRQRLAECAPQPQAADGSYLPPWDIIVTAEDLEKLPASDVIG